MKRLGINFASHARVEFFVHVQRFCPLPGQPRYNEIALTIGAAVVGQDIVLRRISRRLGQRGTTYGNYCDSKDEKLCPARHGPLHLHVPAVSNWAIFNASDSCPETAGAGGEVPGDREFNAGAPNGRSSATVRNERPLK